MSMVSEAELNTDSLVCDIKLSTVVPASITSEDTNHHLGGLDLAMKLYYITTVHFFGCHAAEGLTIHDFKKPMFQWLQLYYPICGRLRRHDGAAGARPYVKCNDSGVRVVEATCAKTVDEWLAAVGSSDHHRLLVFHQPLLPRDFGFTPFVFLQLTKFKCGGVCVGMRWAHILGDAFSASQCINTWGKILANQPLPPHPTAPATNHRSPNITPPSFRSAKLLEPLGDDWSTSNTTKMQAHTFHVTEKTLSSLLPEERKKTYKVEPFDVISAIIWKSVAKLTGNTVITVCKKRSSDNGNNGNALLGNNNMAIGIVEVGKDVEDGDPLELAKAIAEKFVDETGAIEKRVDEENGSLDLVVYGANLTFVNWEDVELYGLQLKGHRPVFADASVRGVGDGGAVVLGPIEVITAKRASELCTYWQEENGEELTCLGKTEDSRL